MNSIKTGKVRRTERKKKKTMRVIINEWSMPSTAEDNSRQTIVGESGL